MSSDKFSQTKSDVDLCIFHDIFRRADKNDDGAISWTEFASYFSDGIVTDDGMRSLFNEIDSHHTNNIDTHELCSYFTERLGSHEPVFQAAAALCSAVSASVKSLADTHAKKSPASQFVDRFLLRELCAHLEAQLQVLRNAHESLRRRAIDLSMPSTVPTSPKPMPQSPPPLPPPPHSAQTQTSTDSATMSANRYFSQQQQQQQQPYHNNSMSSPPRPPPPPPPLSQLPPEILDGLDSPRSVTPMTEVAATSTVADAEVAAAVDGGCCDRLSWEVARLQRLLDRLECRTALVTGGRRVEEADMDGEESLVLIVRRRVTVPDDQMGEFQSAVRKYSASMEAVASCLLLSARRYRETGCVVLYEFWESLGSWRKFLPSPTSKELRRAIVDCTEAPESTETLLLPSEWWKNLER